MDSKIGPNIPQSFVDAHAKAAGSSGIREGVRTGRALARQYRDLTIEQREALPAETFDLSTIGLWSIWGGSSAAVDHSIRNIGR